MIFENLVVSKEQLKIYNRIVNTMGNGKIWGKMVLEK